MSAHIRPTGCRVNCRTTWRHEYGPGRSLPGTHATRGDVRRCEHGNLWVATGRTLESCYFTDHDEWERLTRWGSPIRYRRAVRALAGGVS